MSSLTARLLVIPLVRKNNSLYSLRAVNTIQGQQLVNSELKQLWSLTPCNHSFLATALVSFSFRLFSTPGFVTKRRESDVTAQMPGKQGCFAG